MKKQELNSKKIKELKKIAKNEILEWLKFLAILDEYKQKNGKKNNNK